MTVATAPISLDDQQHIVFDEASWDFYERVLQEIGDGALRVTYDDGRMEIMSPLPEHDSWARRIGMLIGLLCIELDLPMLPTGSATFRSQAKRKGLEPDTSFYLAHAKAGHQIKGAFDANVHTPPDLAIEIDITRRSIAKQPIYAALGVPELWQYDAKRLRVFGLNASTGQYEPRRTSIAFPMLPIDQFEQFIKQFETEENDTAVMRAFQQWVRTLKPPSA